MKRTFIQIGSHVGNTINDPLFNIVDQHTTLILVEPVPFLFEQLKKTTLTNLESTHASFLSIRR